jgi:hypothetical protein
MKFADALPLYIVFIKDIVLRHEFVAQYSGNVVVISGNAHGLYLGS